MRQLSILMFSLLLLRMILCTTFLTDFFTNTEISNFIGNSTGPGQFCIDTSPAPLNQFLILNGTFPNPRSSTEFCIKLADFNNTEIGLTSEISDPKIFRAILTNGVTQISKSFISNSRQKVLIRSLKASPLILIPEMLKNRGLTFEIRLTPAPPVLFICELEILLNGQNYAKIPALFEEKCIFSAVLLRELLEKYTNNLQGVLSGKLILKSNSEIIGWVDLNIRKNPEISYSGPEIINILQENIFSFNINSENLSIWIANLEKIILNCKSSKDFEKVYKFTQFTYEKSLNQFTIILPKNTIKSQDFLSCALYFQEETSQSFQISEKIWRISTFSKIELTSQIVPNFSYSNLENQQIKFNVVINLPTIFSENIENLINCQISSENFLKPISIIYQQNGIFEIICKIPYFNKPQNINISVGIYEQQYKIYENYEILPLISLNSYNIQQISDSNYQIELSEISLENISKNLICSLETENSQHKIYAKFTNNEILCNFVNLYGILQGKLWIEDNKNRKISRNFLLINFPKKPNIIEIFPTIILLGKTNKIQLITNSENINKICYRNMITQQIYYSNCENLLCFVPNLLGIYSVNLAENCEENNENSAKLSIIKELKILANENNFVLKKPIISIDFIENYEQNLIKSNLICVSNSQIFAELNNENLCNFTEKIYFSQSNFINLYIAEAKNPSISLSNQISLPIIHDLTIFPINPYILQSDLTIILSMQNSIKNQWILQENDQIFCEISNFGLIKSQVLNNTNILCKLPNFVKSQSQITLSLLYKNLVISNQITVPIFKQNKLIFENFATNLPLKFDMKNTEICIYEKNFICSFYDEQFNLYKTQGNCENENLICEIPNLNENKMVKYKDFSILTQENNEILHVKNLLIIKENSIICQKIPNQISIFVDKLSMKIIENTQKIISQYIPVEISGLLPEIGFLNTLQNIQIPQEFLYKNFEISLFLPNLNQQFYCENKPKINFQPISLEILKINPNLIFNDQNSVKINIELQKEIYNEIKHISLCCEENCYNTQILDSKNLYAIILVKANTNPIVECKIFNEDFPMISQENFKLQIVNRPKITEIFPLIILEKKPIIFTINLNLPIIAQNLQCVSPNKVSLARVLSATQLECEFNSLDFASFLLGIYYPDQNITIYSDLKIEVIQSIRILSIEPNFVYNNLVDSKVLVKTNNLISQNIKLFCIFDENLWTPITNAESDLGNVGECKIMLNTKKSKVSLKVGINSNQFSENKFEISVVNKPILIRFLQENIYSGKNSSVKLEVQNLIENQNYPIKISSINGLINLEIYADYNPQINEKNILELQIPEILPNSYEISLNINGQYTNSLILKILKMPEILEISPQMVFGKEKSVIQIKFDKYLLTNNEYLCILQSIKNYEENINIKGKIYGNLLECKYEFIENIEKNYTLAIKIGSNIIQNIGQINRVKIPEILEIMPNKISSNGNSKITVKTKGILSENVMFVKFDCPNNNFKITKTENTLVSTSEFSFKSPPFSVISHIPEICNISLSINGINFLKTDTQIEIYPPIQIYSFIPSALYLSDSEISQYSPKLVSPINLYIFGKNLPLSTDYSFCRIFTKNEIFDVKLIPISENKCICLINFMLRNQESLRIELTRNSIDFTNYNKTILILPNKKPIINYVNFSNNFAQLDSNIEIRGQNLHNNLLCKISCSNIFLSNSQAFIQNENLGQCYRPNIKKYTENTKCEIKIIDQINENIIFSQEEIYFIEKLPQIISISPLMIFNEKISNINIKIANYYENPLILGMKISENNYANCTNIGKFEYNCEFLPLQIGNFPIFLSYNKSQSFVNGLYEIKIIEEPRIYAIIPNILICGFNNIKFLISCENMPKNILGCLINDKIISKSYEIINSTNLECNFENLPLSLCDPNLAKISLKISNDLQTENYQVSTGQIPELISVNPMVYVPNNNFTVNLFFESNSLIPGIIYYCLINSNKYQAENIANTILKCNIPPIYSIQLSVKISFFTYDLFATSILPIENPLQILSVFPITPYSDSNITILSPNSAKPSKITCFSEDTELPTIIDVDSIIGFKIKVFLENISQGYHFIKCSEFINTYTNPLQIYVLKKPQISYIFPDILLKNMKSSFTISGQNFIKGKTLIKLNDFQSSECEIKNETVIECGANALIGENDFQISVSTNNGNQWISNENSKITILESPKINKILPDKLVANLIENIILVEFINFNVNNRFIGFYIDNRKINNISVISNNSMLLKIDSLENIGSTANLQIFMNLAGEPIKYSIFNFTVIQIPKFLNEKYPIIIEKNQAQIILDGQNFDMLYNAQCDFFIYEKQINKNIVMISENKILCEIPKEIIDKNQSSFYLKLHSSNGYISNEIPVIFLEKPQSFSTNTSVLFYPEPNIIALTGQNFIYEITNSEIIPIFNVFYDNFQIEILPYQIYDFLPCERIGNTKFCKKSDSILKILVTEQIFTSQDSLKIYLNSGIEENIYVKQFTIFKNLFITNIAEKTLIGKNRKIELELQGFSYDFSNIYCSIKNIKMNNNQEYLVNARININDSSKIICDFSSIDIISGYYEISLLLYGKYSAKYNENLLFLNNEISISSVIPAIFTKYQTELNLQFTGKNLQPQFEYFTVLKYGENTEFYKIIYINENTIKTTLKLTENMKNNFDNFELSIYAENNLINEKSIIVKKIADISTISSRIFVRNTQIPQTLTLTGKNLDFIKFCKFDSQIIPAIIQDSSQISCLIPQGNMPRNAEVQFLNENAEFLDKAQFEFLDKPLINSAYFKENSIFITGEYEKTLKYQCFTGNLTINATVLSSKLLKCENHNILSEISVQIMNIPISQSNVLKTSDSSAKLMELTRINYLNYDWVLTEKILEIPMNFVKSDEFLCEFEYQQNMQILSEIKNCNDFNSTSNMLFANYNENSMCCKIPQIISKNEVRIYLVNNENLYIKKYIGNVGKIIRLPLDSSQKIYYDFGQDMNKNAVKIKGNDLVEFPLNLQCRIGTILVNSCNFSDNYLTFYVNSQNFDYKENTEFSLYISQQNEKFGQKYLISFIPIQAKIQDNISVSPKIIFTGEQNIDLIFTLPNTLNIQLFITNYYQIFISDLLIKCRKLSENQLICSFNETRNKPGNYEVYLKSSNSISKLDQNLTIIQHANFKISQKILRYNEQITISSNANLEKTLYFPGNLYCRYNKKYLVLMENNFKCGLIYQGKTENSDLGVEILYQKNAYSKILYSKQIQILYENGISNLYPSIIYRNEITLFTVNIQENIIPESTVLVKISNENHETLRISSNIYQFSYTCTQETLFASVILNSRILSSHTINCLIKQNIENIEYNYNQTSLNLYLKIINIQDYISNAAAYSMFLLLNSTYETPTKCEFNSGIALFICTYKNITEWTQGKTSAALYMKNMLYGQDNAKIMSTNEKQFTLVLPMKIKNIDPIYFYADFKEYEINIEVLNQIQNYDNSQYYCVFINQDTSQTTSSLMQKGKSQYFYTCKFTPNYASRVRLFIISASNIYQQSSYKEFIVFPQQVIFPQTTYLKFVNDTTDFIPVKLNYIKSELKISCAFIQEPSEIVSATSYISNGILIAKNSEYTEINCTIPKIVSQTPGKYRIKISQTTSYTTSYQLIEILPNLVIKSVTPSIISFYSEDPLTIYGGFSQYAYACSVTQNCTIIIDKTIRTRIGEIYDDRIILWVEGRANKTIAGMGGQSYNISLFVGKSKIQPIMIPQITIYSDGGIANIRPSMIFNYESAFLYIRLQRSLLPSEVSELSLSCSIYKKGTSIRGMQTVAKILNSTFVSCQVPILSPDIYIVEILALAPKKGLLGSGMIQIEPELILMQISPEIGVQSGQSYLNITCLGLEKLSNIKNLNLYCIFNNTNYWSPAVTYSNYQIRCVTPKMAGIGKVQVWVKSALIENENSRNLLYVNSGPINFYVHPNLSANRIYPEKGIIGKYVQLYIETKHTNEFSTRLQCKIYCPYSQETLYVNVNIEGNIIKCGFVPNHKSKYEITVCLESIEFSNKFIFDAVDRLQITSFSKAETYSTGGRQVELVVTNSYNGIEIMCEFNDCEKNTVISQSESINTLMKNSVIKCETPGINYGPAICLRLYDKTMQEYSDNNIKISYLDAPYIQDIIPSTLYIDKKNPSQLQQILIKGSNMRNTYLHILYKNMILKAKDSTDSETIFELAVKESEFTDSVTDAKLVVSHFADYYGGTNSGGMISFARTPNLYRIKNLPIYNEDKEFILIGENLQKTIGCCIKTQYSSQFVQLKSTILNSTYLKCYSSTLNFGNLFGTTELDIGVLLDNTSTTEIYGFKTTIKQLPTINKITPSYGPITGGYKILLSLDSDSDFYKYACLFDNGQQTTNAIRKSSRNFECLVPSRTQLGLAQISLSTEKGYQLQSKSGFLFTAPILVFKSDPSYASIAIKELKLMVNGRGFMNNKEKLKCLLKSVENCAPSCPLGSNEIFGDAKIISDENIECSFNTDPLPIFQRTGDTKIGLAIENIDVTSISSLIRAYKQPIVSQSLLKKLHSNFYIRLLGSGFLQYSGMLLHCIAYATYVNGDLKQYQGVYIGNDTDGKCDLGPINVNIKITEFKYALQFNGEFICRDNETLPSPSFGLISNADSLRVLENNNTIISLYGSFLSEDITYTCWFGNMPVSAKFVSQFKIECTVPNLGVGNYQLTVSANISTTIFEQTIQIVNDIMLTNAEIFTSDWVRVIGTGFSSNCICMFSNKFPTSQSKFISNTILECRMPSQWMEDSYQALTRISVKCGSILTSSTSVPRISITKDSLSVTPKILREGSKYASLSIFSNTGYNIDPLIFTTSCKYDCEKNTLTGIAQIMSQQTISCTIPSQIYGFADTNCQVILNIGYMEYKIPNEIRILSRLRIETTFPKILYRETNETDLLIKGGNYLETSQYYCIFQLQSDITVRAVFMNSSFVQCKIPQINSAANLLSFTVTEFNDFDKSQINEFSSNSYSISIVSDSKISGIDPILVPRDGGYLLNIFGTNFVTGKTAIIFSNSLIIQPTQIFSATSLQVKTPVFTKSESDVISVYATINPQIPQKDNTIKIKLIKLPILSNSAPLILSAGQSETITIKGKNFVSGLQIHSCKWTWSGNNMEEIDATYVSDDHLSCKSPNNLIDGQVSLQIGYKKLYYSKETLTLNAQNPIAITKIIPTQAVKTGGTLIQVYLSKLPVSSVIYCKISDSVDQANIIDSSQKIIGCKVPFIRSAGNYSLEILQDSQKFTNSGILIEITNEAILTNVSPAYGPNEGNTNLVLLGYSFGANIEYKCTFTYHYDGRIFELQTSATRIDSSTINCKTPQISLANLFIKVTLNSTNGESAVGSGLLFYYKKPTITSFFPKYGIMAGGTPITISGTGFLSFMSIQCQFGTNPPVTASIINEDTAILCVTPPNLVYANVQLSVSLDGIYWISAPIEFYYYHQPSVFSMTPLVRLALGFPYFTITGAGFFDSDTLKCRFKFPNCGGGSIEYPGTYISSSTLKCMSPPYIPCTGVVLEFTLNGIEYFTASSDISYSDVPEVNSIIPAYSLYSCIFHKLLY